MKIVHTESSCGWGGQEIRILSEASGMVDLGHEIEIWASPESNIICEANNMGLNTKALPIDRKTIRNILTIRTEIKLSLPDIINTHSSTDTWLVALANTTIKDHPPLIRTRHISAPIPKNFASRWLYTYATEHTVTTGSALKVQMIKDNHFPENRITSIPTGIDTKRFHPGDPFEARNKLGLPLDRKYIGIIATLRSWKGHLYLLDAFSKLDLPGWHLLIVGDGPMRKPIEEKIKQLKLNENVHMVGQQKNPEDWFRALDIFCLPSYANEGVPQSILQAMMTKLPIITTPVGAILDAVTDRKTAIIIEPRNTNHLMTAIQELIDNHKLRKEIISSIRDQAIRKFSLDKMISSMEDIFNKHKGI